MSKNKDTTADLTRGQVAYENLRSDILHGHFAPGTPLRLQALKERYNLSFSPLREALNRLQSERLVEGVAARGFRVPGVSIAEMWDAMEMRILIDCEGIRRSLDRGDDAWEVRVLGSFHSLSVYYKRMQSLGRTTTEERYELESRHETFHATLISASESDWLKRYSSQLYEQTQRYRWPFFTASADTAFLRQSYIEQHQEIAERAVARDPEAVSLLAKSLRRTGEVIELMSQSENSTGFALASLV
mgnify:CR=1 FL=1